MVTLHLLCQTSSSEISRLNSIYEHTWMVYTQEGYEMNEITNILSKAKSNNRYLNENTGISLIIAQKVTFSTDSRVTIHWPRQSASEPRVPCGFWVLKLRMWCIWRIEYNIHVISLYSIPSYHMPQDFQKFRTPYICILVFLFFLKRLPIDRKLKYLGVSPLQPYCSSHFPFSLYTIRNLGDILDADK